MSTRPVHHHHRAAAALAAVTALALSGCSHVASTREGVGASPSATPPATSSTSAHPPSAASAATTPRRMPSATPRATPSVDPHAAILIGGRAYPEVAAEGLGAKSGTFATGLADGHPVPLSLGADLARLAASPVQSYSVTVRPFGTAASTARMCRFDVSVHYAPGGQETIAKAASAYAAAHSGAWMAPSGDASQADQEVAGALGIIPPNDASSMTTRPRVTASTSVPAQDSTMSIVGSADHRSYVIVEACDGSSYTAPDITLGMDPVASKHVIFPGPDGSPFATATVDRNPASGGVSAYAVIDGAEQGDDGSWTRG